MPYGATVSHHHDPRGIKHQRYDHGKIITALEIASASCVIQFSEIIGDLLSRCQKATCDLSPGVASITNPSLAESFVCVRVHYTLERPSIR